MYDVIIIGGSYAGLAAALQLVRARRRVLILDAGQRRNRFAGHSHGFLGQDGQPPGAIAAKGKAEVLAYPTVTWKDALAAEAVRTPDGFVVRAGGDEFRGKRLILATGVVDELPAVPGLEERWGKRVFFCPYCDGYEFGLGSLAVLATSPQSARFAMLISEWAGPGQTTFFLNGQPEPDAHELAQLASRGITIEREPVTSVGGDERSVEGAPSGRAHHQARRSVPAPTHPSQGTVCRGAGLRAGDGAARLLLQDRRDEGDDSQRRFRLRRRRNADARDRVRGR
jgi:thioredoxin reductase